MNEDIKRRVKSCFTDLSTSFDPEGYILGKLFQNDVLTLDQVQEINLLSDSVRRAEKLLYLLFSIPHTRAFVVLREALQREYTWIVELIDGMFCDDSLLSERKRLINIQQSYVRNETFPLLC